MKKNLSLKLLALCIIAFMSQFNSRAQSTMTGSVVVQPCNSNGQVSVTTTGLTPPINYTYTNWAAGVTIVHSGVTTVTDAVTNLKAYQELYWQSPNVWYITASDGSGISNMSIQLNPPFQDTILMSPGLCPNPSTLEATNFIGGTAPFSVVWTNTATAISYPNNPAFVSNGVYTLVITDAAGCVVESAVGNSSLNISVTSVSNINPSVNGSPANCTNGTATITATGGTTPYTYLWSNSSTAQSLSGLSQGMLTCVVTDNIGCQSTAYYYVSQAVTLNFNTTVTNATCLQNNGSILGFPSGGTAPYSFLWSNSAITQNVNNLVGGQTYNVQITDANNCTGIAYVYVSVSTPINVVYNTTASSCTSPTGGATITASGGTAPYTVVWSTFPSSTGVSIANKPSGSYNFVVTDAVGCVNSGAVFIPPASSISANLITTNPICPATTGTVFASVVGSNPPFTYLWNNSATTATLTNVPLGMYSCVITDAAGCSVTKTAYLSQSSPVSVGFSSIPASCKFTNDGSATANALGGTAPYTYTWSNSQTGATINNLSYGNYYVNVTDANGCHVGAGLNSHVYVSYNPTNTSCYCTITGTVYADANLNCVRNTLEAGIPNIPVHCSGQGYVYTNSNGVYNFMVPAGTYTVSESVQSFYPLTSCQSANSVVTIVVSPGCVTTVNFANTITPVHDLRIVTSNMNMPTPGNAYQQKVIVYNDGTMNETTAKLGYENDGQLNYSNCTPWALTQQNSTSFPNWYSITSGFPSLNVNASSTSYINYNVPTNIPINTQVVFKDTIASNAPIATNWLTDYTPWNNVNTSYAYVVSSWDPNFKEVSPQGTGPQGNISTGDSLLTYVVHFQNEGNYFAQNIVVTDTIDADLNIGSLRPGYADHAYSVTIDENRVAKFTFKDIHLAWKSAYGDALSSGMFTYSIKLKRNLAVGTKINNSAAIFFDFNDAVITNKTLNTIATVAVPSSVTELKNSASNDLRLFPNPTADKFNIVYTSTKNSSVVITIYDISGREISSESVQAQAGENQYTAGTSHLHNGIYFVQVSSETHNLSAKLIISK